MQTFTKGRDKVFANLITLAITNGWHVLPRETYRVKDVKWHTKADKFIITYDQHIPKQPGYGVGHRELVIRHRKLIMTLPEVLFNHSFARGLWGATEVNADSFDMTGIRLHFKQVAVQLEDRLIAVPPESASAMEYKVPGLPADPIQDIDMSEVEKITYELEAIYHVIPLTTHRLLSLDLMGVQPKYHYHLKQMVLADDPLEYALRHYND